MLKRNRLILFFVVPAGLLFLAASVVVPKGNDFSQSRGQSAASLKMKIDENSLVEVPNPLSANNTVYQLVAMDEPQMGVPFKDYHFNTDLVRVTQRGKIRHEYSRFDPFNKDQTMIMLRNIDSGDYIVYRTDSMPYEQNQVRTITNLEEPRWDPQNTKLLWGVRDFSIITLDTQTGTEIVIKDFSADAIIGPIIAADTDLYRITMRDEGESSYDKRYWAFALQGTDDDYKMDYIFTWDREQDTVPGLYQVPLHEREIDWVGMSYGGNYVLIGGDYNNGGNLAGLTMANRELTRFHRLDYATAHSDVGLDANGNEVIVMQNIRTDHVDLIPVDWNTQPILESGGSYEGTNRTPLVILYYASGANSLSTAGIHVSCNYPGYCVISTYIEAGNQETNWLDRTNILVKLDRTNARAFYLSKVYGTYQNYWEETHATISNDGSKVIWASNWGRNVGSEQIFLIQLNMPMIQSPIPHIKANGQEGPISVSSGTPVSITVSLNPGGYAGQNADWWVAESTPSGTFNHYDLSTGSMIPGLSPTHQGPLFNLGSTQLLNSSDLTVGTHTFYFGVDLIMNGSLDMDSIYYDWVSVNVTGP